LIRALRDETALREGTSCETRRASRPMGRIRAPTHFPGRVSRRLRPLEGQAWASGVNPSKRGRRCGVPTRRCHAAMHVCCHTAPSTCDPQASGVQQRPRRQRPQTDAARAPMHNMHAETSQTSATHGVVGGCRKICHKSVGGAFVRLAAPHIECWRHIASVTWPPETGEPPQRNHPRAASRRRFD